MSPLDRVCAIVDAQGFSVGHSFYVRELTVKGVESCITLEFDPRINEEELTERAQRTIRYQTEYVHGLSLRPWAKVRSSRDIVKVLKGLYKVFKYGDERYFACKNQKLAVILRKAQIPFVDLKEYGAPPMRELDRDYGGDKFCRYHNSNERSSWTCSERKARHLSMWLTNWQMNHY